MCSSHCKNQCVPIDRHNVPRARQPLCLRRLIAFFIEAFLASANHSQDFLGREVNLADRMILTVTEVQEVLVLAEDVAHALRVMELRLIIGSINEADFTVSDLVFELHRFLVDDHDSVVGGVGDDQQVAVQAGLLFNTDELAGVAEILPAGRPLLTRLANRLIDALCLDLVRLLLLGLPSYRRSMVQLFVIKIIRHR